MNIKKSVLLFGTTVFVSIVAISQTQASGSESGGGGSAAAEKQDDGRNESREELRKKLREKRKIKKSLSTEEVNQSDTKEPKESSDDDSNK